MLLVRSLGVATAGMWRFLLVVPFLLALILLLTIIIGSRSWFFAAIFFASSANLAMLVAMRTAFAQIGEYSAPDLMKLIFGGVKYWFLHAVVTLILFAAAGMIVKIADVHGMTGLGAEIRQSGLAPTFDSLMTDPFFAAMIWGESILSGLFWTALLVPQAAVAWSSAQNREPFDLFWGFGARFLALLPVVLLTFGVIFVTGAADAAYRFVVYAFMATFALLLSVDLDPLTRSEITEMAVGCGIVVLAAYWQAVAAALAFVDRRDEAERARAAAYVTTAEDKVDAAALRRMRQQG